MANPILENDLAALILTFNAVTNIIGTGNDARVYPDETPQGISAAHLVIEITREDYEPGEDLEFKGGLVKATVVISAISSRKIEARALAEALRTNGTDPVTGLSGYDGPAGNAARLIAKLDFKESGYVAEQDGSDSGRYAVDSYYTVWFQESK